MANALINIKEDAAPTKQLASQTTDTLRSGSTVHREETVLGDPTVDAAVAKVLNAAPSTEYGLVTRNIPSGTQPVSGTVTAVDGGASLTVDALDLDIRNLAHASDSVRLGDGTDLTLVTAAGELNVLATAQPGIDIGDVTINNAAGASAVNVQDGGNSLTVDNTVLSVVGGGTEATAQRVTIANDSTGLISIDDNGASLTVDNPTLSVVNGGTEATALRVTIANDSTGVLSVDDNGGILTVDGTIISNVGTGTRPVAGDVAHDTADSGNPVKIGGKAYGALPTAVTADDRVNTYFDREGRSITRPWGAGEWSQVHLPAVNTRATSTKAAGAAGVRHLCTGLTVVLAGDSTAPAATVLDVRLRDGIADTGTILWQSKIVLPAVAGAMNGVTRSGLHIKGTAATAMTLEFSAAGGANTFESVSFEGVDITEA